MTIVALDPTSGPVDGTARRRLAARPRSLAGQRLGLVVNGLGYSERFLDALGAELLATTELDGVGT